MSSALEQLRALRAARMTDDADAAPDSAGSTISVSKPSTRPEATTRFTETERGYLVPDDLPGRWKELYEERAAIREFERRQPREHAEAEALAEVVAMIRQAEA